MNILAGVEVAMDLFLRWGWIGNVLEHKTSGEWTLGVRRVQDPLHSFPSPLDSCALMTFKIDRTKLNPKFDGYKLASLDEANTVRRIPLPANGISQATVSASSYLFFQEVQARIKFNHLAVGSDSDTYATLGYIDKDGTFTVVRLDKVDIVLSLRSYSNSSPDLTSSRLPPVI